jgi:shikimate dehydrogenase
MNDRQRAACIIGWPARHSRSPKLHGYWLARYGISGAYCVEEVAPEDFPAFLASLAERGYVGANVTLPHKEAALSLSQADERAVAVGAANTLWFDNGRLRSTNTDVDGFLSALDASVPGWDRRVRTAVVLGAGGGSRAILYGLIERGVQAIHLANRTSERAVALGEWFGPRVRPLPWDRIPAVLSATDLLVNTTSLGMKGEPDLDLDPDTLPDHAIVADIVYVPLRTTLLTRAKRRGLAACDGLDMLLHQAVRGFELWFGVRPEVTRGLRELLVADLERG